MVLCWPTALGLLLLQVAAPAGDFQIPSSKNEYKPITPEDLSNYVPDPDMMKLPPGVNHLQQLHVSASSN
jgi:hypothetical protein